MYHGSQFPVRAYLESGEARPLSTSDSGDTVIPINFMIVAVSQSVLKVD